MLPDRYHLNRPFRVDDLDSMSLYQGDRVWSFELSPYTCEPDRGSESFFEEFAERLPMEVTAHFGGAYDAELPALSFHVSADGSIG